MIALLFILQAGVLAGLALFIEPTDAPQVAYSELIINALTFASIAYIGVGLFSTRTFRDATARLGLVRPTGLDVGIALGCVVIALAVSVGSSVLVQWLQPEMAERLEETLTNLTGDLDIFWAAAAIGICAAVGEELLFRGAIQPRFGIVFTSLVFAVLHVQYEASLLIVGLFFAGIVFGLERKYVNTTACIITHALYNFIAVMATFA
jgi:membrane protease YdiL (CAAX protease family)